MNINDALKRAIFHHNENRISEAEALYRSVLEFEINHPIASVLLAKILLQTGRPNAVEKILKTVISHHAYYMQAYNAMGCLLYTSPSPRDVEESRMPSSA